jgi:hypothetical protein
MRHDLVPAGLAAAAYALLELAFFVRRNLLLPWEPGHLVVGSMFLLVHGITAFGALVVAAALARRFAPGLAASLPPLAPLGTLILIHAVSHYRERVNARPRDLEGSLVTVALFAGIAAAVIWAAWLLRASERRARIGASAAGVVVIGLGLFRCFTVAPVGEAEPVAPRPELDWLAAVETAQRVLLFGVDGASWDVLEPLMAEERLPNLSALVERGRALRLESIRPTFSPVIWTSIATGKDRFQHGIHDVVQTQLPGGTTLPRSMNRTAFFTKTAARFLHFLHRAGLTKLTPYRSSDIGATSVFEAASEAGLATTRVEWYVSWPAGPLAGVNVTDRFHLQDPVGDPMPGAVWPGALGSPLLDHVVTPDDVPLDRILELVDTEGLSAGEASAWARARPRFVAEMRHNLARDLSTRNVAVDLLARDEEWRLFGLYFRAVDLAHHLTWSLRNATGDPAEHPELRLSTVVDRYHELIDGIIGEVLAEVPDDVTIVMLSDHGFEDRYQHARAPDGFAILAGPTVVHRDQDETKGAISVYDVAPTVATLLGLPVPSDLAGRARTDLLDPEFVDAHVPGPVTTWEREGRDAAATEGEDRAVEEAELERLRALGYIQ